MRASTYAWQESSTEMFIRQREKAINIFEYQLELDDLSLSWFNWLRNATLLDLRRTAAASDGDGDMHGVEHRLLLRSHWSTRRNNSSGDGPPFVISTSTKSQFN